MYLVIFLCNVRWLAKADSVDKIPLVLYRRCAKGWQNMIGKKDILELLKGRSLTPKEISNNLDLPLRSVYRYVKDLVGDGSILKLDKVVNGKSISIYSLPVIAPGVCGWDRHKQLLLTSKLYSGSILETDYWDSFKQEIVNLRKRKETLDVLITGLKGVGKSVTGIWLANILDSSFSVSRNVVLRKEQLLKLAIDQPENMTLLLDDLGTSLSSRGWAEGEREAIFDYFEICRQSKVDLIGTTPSLDLVDLNFRRLVLYLWDIQLRCDDHIHIVVHRNINPGLKPTFRPVGVFVLPFPDLLYSVIQEYDSLKREKLRGTARDSLEKLDRAEQGVKKYVNERELTGITDDVVRSALATLGLDGDLSKKNRDHLRTEMYNSLQEKKQRERKVKLTRVKQGKENLKQARLDASYNSKYQSFLDRGYSESFTRVLCYRLVYEKDKAVNLKNLFGILGSLLKKVRREHLERFVLNNLDSFYLVVSLKIMRDFLNHFKLFEEDFYTKLFLMARYEPEKARNFVSKAISWRDSSLYKYHGKFSPKRWKEGVVSSLKTLEDNEKRKRINEKADLMAVAGGIDLADKIGKLFGKDLKKTLGVKGNLREESKKEFERRTEKPFWWDI